MAFSLDLDDRGQTMTSPASGLVELCGRVEAQGFAVHSPCSFVDTRPASYAKRAASRRCPLSRAAEAAALPLAHVQTETRRSLHVSIGEAIIGRASPGRSSDAGQGPGPPDRFGGSERPEIADSTKRALASNDGWRVREAMLERHDLSDDLLVVYAADDDWRNAMAVAERPHLPPQAHMILAESDDWRVRDALSKHPAACDEALEMLASRKLIDRIDDDMWPDEPSIAVVVMRALLPDGQRKWLLHDRQQQRIIECSHPQGASQKHLDTVERALDEVGDTCSGRRKWVTAVVVGATADPLQSSKWRPHMS